MISVAEARTRIVAAFQPLPAETVSIAAAHGRVLAAPLVARRSQPPFDAAAMDGYAVQAADIATVPARLRLIGEVPAGGCFDGVLAAGQAVRIFTGAPVPAGADSIVIQENTVADGDWVRIVEASAPHRHIRRAGLDFAAGDTVIAAETLLSARHIGLAAATNHPWLAVHRRPRVAILATGDEVVLPGDPIGPNQIVSSNGLAIAALVAGAGGVPTQLGIAADDPQALRELANAAAGSDLLITTGGASVGAHDLVGALLKSAGGELDFWKIAMRPGKPLLFGRFGGCPVIGLPGNPVSAIVCALVFALPALKRLQGLDPDEGLEAAIAGKAMPANDSRQDFLRATLRRADDGRLVATPAERQDSSMLRTLAAADGLIVRAPHAASVVTGDRIDVLRFSLSGLPI